MSVYTSTSTQEEYVRTESASSTMVAPAAIVLPSIVVQPDYLWFDCSGESLD